MNQTRRRRSFLTLIFFLATALTATGQASYTGTILSYGSGFNTRTTTNSFRLKINSNTSDSQVNEFLQLLQSGGQNDLLEGIRKENLGRFSVNGGLGRDLNVVRTVQVDGKTKIYVVFERWTQFGELRGGYRSLDYPFTYMELLIDPATGKGEGTFIAAAKIRWKKDKDESGYHIEIEDFATFPSRLLNVRAQKPQR